MIFQLGNLTLRHFVLHDPTNFRHIDYSKVPSYLRHLIQFMKKKELHNPCLALGVTDRNHGWKYTHFLGKTTIIDVSLLNIHSYNMRPIVAQTYKV